MSDGKPIPAGVYYSAESDNFYCAAGRGGLGMAFWQTWRERKHDFPQSALSEHQSLPLRGEVE